MYIQYIKRGIFRAFLALIGLCAIVVVAPLTHAEGTLSITNATTTEAANRGVAVSFSLTSPTEQDDVRYGIAVYTKDQSGKTLLADFISSENGVSLPAGQAVSGTITYTPPEQLIGTYDLALVIRGKGGDAVLGETPLDAHTFAMGDAVPLEVTTCQFHTLPEAGSIRCGIGNTGSTPQTFTAALALHRADAFGVVMGATTQTVTVPAATVAQIDFMNLPKNVTPGAYVAQLSFTQQGSLRARTNVQGTIEAPAPAQVETASGIQETPSAAPANNIRYIGGLILALLLLLGVLVLSRRRAPIAAFVILTGAGLVAIATAPFALADTQESAPFADPASVNASGNAYCSDFYKPNSVLIHASPDSRDIAAGFPLAFSGEIQNTNPYPIVDTQIYAKVYRTDTQTPLTPRNGYPMVAFFLVKDGFSLPASTTQPFAFTWNLPNALPRGDYEMVLYVTSAHRYNLLGLPFNDGTKGAVVPFTVTASPEKEEPPAFNKDGVTLNGEPYYFKEPEPAFPEGKPVTVTAPLKNPGSVERAVKVTYKVYNYEGGSEENLIDQKVEVVTLKSGQTLPLSYTVQPHNHIVSYVLIDAAFEDVHSLMNVRFFYTGGTQSEARVKFPGISYPLTAGHEAVAFSCLNALNGAGMYGTLTTTVTKPGGEELAKKTFSGLIMSQVVAFGLKFVPKEDVTDFDVTTELAQKNGTVLERVTQQYRCADIDPSACKKRALSEGTSTHGISFLILGALLLICIGVVALLYLKSKKTLPPIAPLVFCFILTLGMFTVHAPSAQAIAPPGDDNGMYECTDGDDNDADGLTDYDDPDCHGPHDDYEGGSSGVSACVDGVDNDGDGRIDYDPTGAGDPDCTSFIDLDESGTATYPACVDGVDNDGDGLVDGNDPGCVGNTDADETDPEVASASTTEIISAYLNKKTTSIQMTEPDRMLPAGAGVAWVSPSGNVWAAASMNDGSILSSGSRVYLEFPRSDNDLAVTAYGEAESDPPACWADFVSPTYQNGSLTGFQGCAMQAQHPIIICNTQPCNRVHVGPFTFGAVFVQPSITLTTSNTSALSCDPSFTCTAGSVLATTSVNIIVHFSPITVYPGTDGAYEISVPMSGQPNDITFSFTVVPSAANTSSFLGQNVVSGAPVGTPASSVTVPQGENANLVWSTNAAQCTRSMSPRNAFWSGTSAVASGNEIKSVGLAVGNYQLYLDCGTAPRKTVTLYVTTPSATKNLTAENLVVPATLQTGQPLTISGSVHNTGAVTLSGFTDNFTYCVVGTGCNSNSWQTMSGHLSEASLVAGASRADSYTTWNPTAGQYRVQYCVDSQNSISDESNEGDNCAQSGTLTVTDGAVLTCGGSIPTNGVSWGAGEEPPTVPGTNWTFSATNQFAQKCQYKCNTGYTYDSDTQTCVATSSPSIALSASPSSAVANPTMASTTLSWTATNFTSNSCRLLRADSATRPYAGLAVVANGLASSDSFVQSQSQGTKYYMVLCDGTLYSNVVSFTVTTAATPDLASNLSPSINGTPTQGQSVTFNGQVKNVGSVPVSASFSDEFSYRWGMSGAWTPIDPPTGGDILKSYSAGAPFAVGATADDTSSSFTLSQSGPLQIQHCIDSLMQIVESDEANNCRTTTFSIAAPPPHVCTGPVPANASLCAGDDLGLSSDTPRSAVNACTPATKCEYQCSNGYVSVLNRCISGTITGTPTEVAPGGTSDITWSIGGDTTGLSCAVTGGSDSWSGTSGTQTSSPINAQTLYVLSCNGIAIDSVTINLIGGPVLTANPRIVSGGGTSVLTYDLKANTNCTLTGGGFNQALLSPTGTITSNAIFGTTKYTITCDGGISSSATVELREEGHET